MMGLSYLYAFDRTLADLQFNVRVVQEGARNLYSRGLNYEILILYIHYIHAGAISMHRAFRRAYPEAENG